MPLIKNKAIHEFGDEHYIDVFGLAFAAGATRSGAANLDGRAPVMIYVPAQYSATQGLTLRIQVSTGGTTYYPLWNAGTAVTVAVAPSQAVRIDPTLMWGMHRIRLHSTEPRGTASTQHACTISLIARLI